MCAGIAVGACQRRGEVGDPTAAAAAAETARPAQLMFPEAARAEALLRGAGEKFITRNDLIAPEFPEGCVWHAVYSAEAPEVILELYAFESADRAAEFGADRQRELAAGGREARPVTNGVLLLVAHFEPAADVAAKQATLTKFVAAFAGGEK